MAIDADHTPYLVNIGFKLLVFYTKRPEMFISGGVWCAVFIVEVLLKSAIVIGTDIISIMT